MHPGGPVFILCTPIIFTARQRFQLEVEGNSVLFNFRNLLCIVLDIFFNFCFLYLWKINEVVMFIWFQQTTNTICSHTKFKGKMIRLTRTLV